MLLVAVSVTGLLYILWSNYKNGQSTVPGTHVVAGFLLIVLLLVLALIGFDSMDKTGRWK